MFSITKHIYYTYLEIYLSEVIRISFLQAYYILYTNSQFKGIFCKFLKSNKRLNL